MKISAGVCLMAAFLLAGPAMGSDEHVAIFKSVSGPVKVVRLDADLSAVTGMGLLKSDKVVSGAGASSGIVFKDGTLLTVGSSSEVVIRDYVFEPRDSKYAFSLYLAKGTAIYSSGKIGKLSPDSVSVDTPKATIGVRGTRFIVKAE
jgi:hypothetical protein